MINLEGILKTFLYLYWLRPETALFRTMDCWTMTGFDVLSPSLDIGCGDGIFSFTRAGGKLRPEFDVFQHVTKTDNFFDNVDVYDTIDENVGLPDVVINPSYKFDLGLDHKENLLKRAALLGLYQKTVVHDANTKFPFADDSFLTIFSNILYWLNSVENILEELRRILRTGGKIGLMVPDISFFTSPFASPNFGREREREREREMDKYDRSRYFF